MALGPEKSCYILFESLNVRKFCNNLALNFEMLEKGQLTLMCKDFLSVRVNNDVFI